MPGPWEQYQQQPAATLAPWEQYQQQPTQAPAAPMAPNSVQAGLGPGGGQQGYSPRTDPLFQAGQFAGTYGPRAVGAIANFAADPFAGVRRFIGTGLLNDPRIEQIEQTGKTNPGTAAVDKLNQATGFEPVKPSTELTPGGALSRIGHQTVEGATTGAPFGPVGSAIGGAAGLLGSAAKEVGNYYYPERADQVGELASMVPGVLAAGRAAFRRQPAPSARELTNAGGAGYDALRRSGLEYESAPTANWAGRERQALHMDGLPEELAGTTHRLLGQIENPPATPGTTVTHTFGQLHALRTALGKVATQTQDGRPTQDALAASRVIPRLDAYMENPGAMSLAAGTPAQAAAAAQQLRDANANYSAGLRSNTLTGGLARGDQGILPQAEGAAAAANSGANLDNAIRQRARSLVNNEARLRPYTDQEVDALRTIERGTLGRNAARNVGNFLGGGRGLGGLISGGAGAGIGYQFGPVGAMVGSAVLPGTGMLLKGLENRLTRRGVLDLDEQTRARSPLYEQQLRNIPPLERQAQIARGLLPAILGY